MPAFSITPPLFSIDRFLANVDRLSDHLGLSVPPMLPPWDDLARLPLGTLGRELVVSCDRQQLRPFTTGPRRKQLHDLIHVITGYGTDAIGEAEVQAFLLGAKFSPLQILLGLGLLRLIARQQTWSPDVWQRLQQAYDRGQRSTLDIDQWQPEHQWGLSLTKVRQQLQMTD